jgi:exodeoxyribonuclease VII large subunit
MSNTAPPAEAVSHNAPIYSVTELSMALKRSVEDRFHQVRVRGEVSGLKRAGSGHLYLSLKDQDAVLDGVCWRGTAARLSFDPSDGIEVICTGRLTTYPGRSRYQIVIDHIEPAGIGALMARVQARREALAAEGLFDETRKRPLPYLPEVIGVVTSESGAVIRDILHRLRDRFPRRVLVWPVMVQGEGAADEIAAAIAGFNRLPPDGTVTRPDLLIVARGGGSLEDLWAFNEESVVRAAAASQIPLISAVGHETDTTLIDFAADRRAPTPSAAAEMAVPVIDDLRYTVADYRRRIVGALSRRLRDFGTELRAAARGLHDPRELLDLARQRLDESSERLALSLTRGLERRHDGLNALRAALRPHHPGQEIKRQRENIGAQGRQLEREIGLYLRQTCDGIEGQGKLLETLSYHNVLDRGFAVIRDLKDRPLTRAAAVKPGVALALEFADGDVHAVADRPPSRATRPRAEPPTDRQGRLL